MAASPFYAPARGRPAFATPQPAGSSKAGTSVFVFDLDTSIPAEDLTEGLRGLFSVFGLVMDVKPLPGWRDSAQAIVTFANRAGAEAAMAKINGFSVWGRPLRLAYANASDGAKVGGRPATAPQPRREQAVQSQAAFEDIRRELRSEFGWRDPAEKPASRSPQAQGRALSSAAQRGAGGRGSVEQAAQEEDEEDEEEDEEFRVAQNVLLELEHMVRERDEQLERMQGAERALRELERQRDELRSELERAGEGGHELSDISCSAMSEADEETSGFDLDSVPLDENSRDLHSGGGRPVRGARIVDAGSPPASTQGGARGAVRRDGREAGGGRSEDAMGDFEEHELDGLELRELAEMLGGDPVMSSKIMQLEQMLKVANYMRELDGLMSALSSNEAGEQNGLLAEQALEVATERLRGIEETLARIPGGLPEQGFEEESGDQMEGEDEEGGDEDDEGDGEQRVRAVWYPEEAYEDESGRDESVGDSESYQMGDRMQDGRGAAGEGIEGISTHLEQELNELRVLQDRIGFLKGLLKETREQQRMLETESSAAATQDDREEGSLGDDEGIGGGENDDYGEEEDNVGSLERPPSAQNRSTTPQQGGQRPTSRLSWADEEGGRRYLADDDGAEMPPVRPVSRLSSLVECASPSSEGSEDLGSLLLASTSELQDLKTAQMFCKRLPSPSERRRFLRDFCRFFQARGGAISPMPSTSADRATTATSPKSPLSVLKRPAQPRSYEEAGLDNEGDMDEDVTPMLLLRELQGLNSQSARRHVLAHIRALKGRGGEGTGSGGSEGNSPKKRPSVPSSTPQRPAPLSTPQRQAPSNTPQRQAPSRESAGSAVKQSPHHTRYNYFVRHLEDEAESPNKLPDDRRPAFDDTEEGESEIVLDTSHAGNESIGTPFDYAESVSSAGSSVREKASAPKGQESGIGAPGGSGKGRRKDQEYVLGDHDISRIERTGSGYEFLEVKIEDLPEDRLRFDKDGIKVGKKFQADLEARAQRERQDFNAAAAAFHGAQEELKEHVIPESFPVHIESENKLTRQQRRRLAELGMLLQGDPNEDELPSTVSYEGSSTRSGDEDDFELEVGDSGP